MLNASKLRMAVTNQVQQGIGIRIQVIPGARCFTVVVTKLMALITDPTQNRPILTNHRSVPMPCPGPAATMALKGAYCVHPAMEAPPGTKKAEMRTRNAAKVVQKPDML